MSPVEPSNAGELAEMLRECAAKGQTMRLEGRSSKRSMGGPLADAAQHISTKKLNRILLYEASDLTVSVEAGCRWSDLQQALAANRQMVALDPPFAENATVGGVIATNSSGPLRRGYGTARDLVIGMKFATLEGKLVQSGGMVVKNVAGLDMGKLMIGSFGTLAAITNVNFRLHSLPEATRTYLRGYAEMETALEFRNHILESVLQPVAIDLLSPAVALRFGRRGYILAVRAAGSERLLARYDRELADGDVLNGPAEATFWRDVQEFAPKYLREQAEGVVIRVSSTLRGLASLPKTVAGSFIARAGSGGALFYFSGWGAASAWLGTVRQAGITAVVEHAPQSVRERETLWSEEGTPAEREGFAMMEKVKQMFDPQGLLNRRRMYGRI